MSLRRTPFRRVLYRPNLFLGGERELTLSTAVVALALAVTGQNLVSLGVAVLLWSGCIGVFRAMAKTDPQMSRVYARQLRYRGYYPARSRPAAGGTVSAGRPVFGLSRRLLPTLPNGVPVGYITASSELASIVPVTVPRKLAMFAPCDAIQVA